MAAVLIGPTTKTTIRNKKQTYEIMFNYKRLAVLISETESYFEYIFFINCVHFCLFYISEQK
jgi:hypothetical protein